jgi:hypothetical protein
MTMEGLGKPEIKNNNDSRNIENSLGKAATYEQLLSSWEELIKRLDAAQVAKFGTLAYYLNGTYSCFKKAPFECDSAVKYIFNNVKLREELKEAGILEEFMLHTVRVGSIKGILARIEKHPGEPVELFPDGTVSRQIFEEVESDRLPDEEAERKRLFLKILELKNSPPTLDGYSWANRELETLQKQENDDLKQKMEESKLQNEREKLMALGRIKEHMHEQNFHLSEEDAKLLHEDFANKLILWKAVLENKVGNVLTPFLEEYGDLELTPEIYTKFKDYYENNNELHGIRSGRSNLPLEIIDPNSAWFSVLIINKKTKLREFIRSAYNNINSWFEL